MAVGARQQRRDLGVRRALVHHERVRTVDDEVPLALGVARQAAVDQGYRTGAVAEHLQAQFVVVLVPHPEDHGGLAQAIVLVGHQVRPPVDHADDGQHRGAVRIARVALRSARPLRARRPSRSDGPVLTVLTRHALRSLRPTGALFALQPLRTGRSLRSDERADIDPYAVAAQPAVAGVERDVRIALGLRLGGQVGGRGDRALQVDARARWTLDALRTDGPLNTLRPLRARRPDHALRPSDVGARRLPARVGLELPHVAVAFEVHVAVLAERGGGIAWPGVPLAGRRAAGQEGQFAGRV